MLKRKNIIKKIENSLPFWKKYCMFAMVLLVAYIQFLNPYITCDHMGQALFQTKAAFPDINALLSYFSGGRYGNIFFGIFYFILGKFHISHYENIYAIQILGILFFAGCCVILHNLFSEFFSDRKHIILLDAIILICFVNPFMVETYLYGSFDWAFGIWFAVLAAKYLFQKRYLLGFIMAFLTVSIYQTNIFIVMIVTLFACFLKNIYLEKKKFYIEGGISCFLCGVAAILNILIFKLFSVVGNAVNPAKTPEVAQNYFTLVLDILSQLKTTYVFMFSTYPLRFIPYFVASLCAGTVFFLIWKKKYYQMFVWVCVTGTLFFLPFGYMLAANSVWCTQRTLLPVFFAMSCFLMGTFFFVKENRYLYQTFVAACIFFFGVTFYYTETLITDCFIGQALDYSEVICIEDEIREYEETTGIEVDTLSWKKSEGMEYVHPLLRLQDGNICSHRIICDAGDYLFAYVSQKDYNLLWMTDEEYEKYFEKKDWKVFNPSEQLHFEGNICYWVVY